MKGGPVRGICELTLSTDDPERLASFYADLGLEELLRENGRIWLAAGDQARLGIWPPGEKEHDDEGGRHVHFALSVTGEALDRMTATLGEMDVALEGPVEHDGGDRSVYFDDPAGNRVELWDYFESGEGAREGVAAMREG